MTAPPIPVDYSVSIPFPSSHLTVHSADGTVAFTVRDAFPRLTRTLHDSLGFPLISAVHRSDGVWEGFRGDCLDPRCFIFTARRIPSSKLLVDMEVFMACELFGCSFRLSGSPSRRSCTIYRGNSIVAQSNLMYKLRKVWYSTREFRLTVYSGIDHALAVALVAIFLWGDCRIPCSNFLPSIVCT